MLALLLKCTQWRVLQCLLYTYVPPSSFSSPLSSLLYNASEESLRRAATSHLTLEEEDDHHHHHRQQQATSARSGRVRKSTHSKQVLISNQRLLGMCALPALVATASGADSILQLVTTTDRQRLSMAKSVVYMSSGSGSVWRPDEPEDLQRQSLTRTQEHKHKHTLSALLEHVQVPGVSGLFRQTFLLLVLVDSVHSNAGTLLLQLQLQLQQLPSLLL